MDNKDIGFIKSENNELSAVPKGFLSRRMILLFLLLLTGIVIGSFLTVRIELFGEVWYIPQIFSGLPMLEDGIASCLATYLSNAFISLSIILIMGVTIFGVATIPTYMLLKGVLVAVRMMSCFQTGEITIFVRYAIIYTPYLAISSFLLILFATDAMELSQQFFRDDSRSKLRNVDMRRLLKNYLIYLFFAVIASLGCLFLVFLYSIFI